MSFNNRNSKFSAPVIPAASPIDGLIPTANLDQPIAVEVVLWDGVRSGYTIQLKLNGFNVGEVKAVSDMNGPGDTFLMHLEERYLMTSGLYHVGFEVTNHINQVSEDSPVTPLIVDRTAPGATLLAPIIFPQINFGDVLKGAIPGYADMQPGDRIQTLCNGLEGPVHVVTPQDLTDRPVQIGFEREFLKNLDSEHITFSYQITDRAGNVSIMAQLVELSMQR
ncbi:hypothetical protein NRB15_18025 [Pseudomonas alliivorans]|uniref:hypothetical protein n=1 Tax=Pseudomonas alliivorans TaxID=2810613 RepID=UPI00211C3926|nr:hypothetical protein [Pseudomonas alliivorans]MCQ9472242.1 hypothetical protein [Pseudomonas alliivorans]